MKAAHVRTRKYIITGIFTIIPIWITWLVVRFVVNILRQAGGPLASWVVSSLDTPAPWLARWLDNAWFQTALAIIFVIAALYLLGWLATNVIGRKLIHLFDKIMQSIPLVEKIYGSVKKLLASFQQNPDEVQRVVLIDFPSKEMKTVGFVTRTMKDKDTGKTLAAVYVPTTPNPTSGYLEIVPVERLTSTSLTVDEAMTFIVSGGAVAPHEMNYEKSAAPVTGAAAKNTGDPSESA